MASDLESQGSLRRSTALWMWVAYGVHAAGTARGLMKPDGRLPVGPLAPSGWAAAGAGAALCLAGMGSFASAGEIEGTRHDGLTTSGVYRYSRNPQYVGYVVCLIGLSVARRSALAGAMAAAAAIVYAQWVPAEEAHLRSLYGEPYGRYLARTNRWWGRQR